MAIITAAHFGAQLASAGDFDTAVVVCRRALALAMPAPTSGSGMGKHHADVKAMAACELDPFAWERFLAALDSST